MHDQKSSPRSKTFVSSNPFFHELMIVGATGLLVGLATVTIVGILRSWGWL